MMEPLVANNFELLPGVPNSKGLTQMHAGVTHLKSQEINGQLVLGIDLIPLSAKKTASVALTLRGFEVWLGKQAPHTKQEAPITTQPGTSLRRLPSWCFHLQN